MFGLTLLPGGNKLGAGKAKYKRVFRPRPILGNTTSEKSAGFSICCVDCSQGSYSYIILTLVVTVKSIKDPFARALEKKPKNLAKRN